MQKFGAGPKKVGKHRRAQLAKLRARSVDDGEANKNAGFALFLMAAYYATGIIRRTILNTLIETSKIKRHINQLPNIQVSSQPPAKHALSD